MSESLNDADANFVRNMKAAREARGWSQAVLVDHLELLGVETLNQSTVSRIEKGERDVRLPEARAIAKVFSVSLDTMSSGPEKFESYLDWQRVYGAFRDARKGLARATVEYEDARRTLAEYLREPGVRLAEDFRDKLMDDVERTASDEAHEAEMRYRSDSSHTASAAYDEPPF
ncbi:helix-turn-helix domain-containing protein [Brooklawnia cerclae]|uniref:Transcriptional regulator with XRE-family HTH domain n=1 Tax=Brooklawnia cerclae TaxID=349934 RepID=A0ABX0SBH0_9ACTN|nr:transcriptional regulator with XRE-family HTH domain [Brooklawnia cerclae]